jgi:hypothetical protein
MQAMDAATLLLLTASVGVGFGWQPMPDGSPRVEYLVQIEPEMLTALQAGSTIPIVSEVPEEIGPIGRVRIVIGRETLPRQNLPVPLKTIRNKPTSEAPSPMTSAAPHSTDQQDSAVHKAQYNGSVPTLPGSRAQGYAQRSGVSSQSAQGQDTPAPALSASPSGGTMFQKAIEAGERQAAEAQAAVAQSASAVNLGPYQQPLDATKETFPGQRLDQPVPVGSVSAGSPGSASGGPRLSTGQVAGLPVSGSSALGLSLPQSTTPSGGKSNHWLSQSSDRSTAESTAGKVASGENRQPVNHGSATERKPFSNAPVGPGFPVAASSTQPAGNTQFTPVVPAGQAPPAVQLQAAQPPVVPANNGQAAADNGPGIFSLLLAWVLLMGSVAGNLYLFWSYLDIRGKYLAMIRSNQGPRHQYSRAG